MPRTTGLANFTDLRTPAGPGVLDAVTTRPSATANFFVDSEDKPSAQQSGDFLISKNGEALFNGFFNRLTVQEIVMDWGIPNVSPYWNNAQIRIQNTFTGTTATLNFLQGFFTARQMLETVVAQANAAFTSLGDPLQLTLSLVNGTLGLVSTGVGNDPFQVINDTPNQLLARQLFATAQLGSIAVPNPAPVGPSGFPTLFCSSPRILGTTYIDIVSSQLTYNQELKDNTSANIRRDVLYRWYLAHDNVPPVYDQFLVELPAGAGGAPAVQTLYPTNYPIIQGYTQFVARRTPPVPKQIRWSPEQPIGQVSFQCYDDQGRLINTANFAPAGIAEEGANFQFQMSLLLSED
jgi:hypothetical protein